METELDILKENIKTLNVLERNLIFLSFFKIFFFIYRNIEEYNENDF